MKKSKRASTEESFLGEIIIQGGVVTRISAYSLVYIYPESILQRELEGRFSLYVSDRPEGNQTTTGTLYEVLRDANSEDARKQCVDAFGLTNPTEADLKKIFPRHKIIIN
ncbi:MAG: hypothetical protein Q7S16_02035 [bacterium]|nr:hypothetical protein [bacterium]